jgi:transposase
MFILSFKYEISDTVLVFLKTVFLPCKFFRLWGRIVIFHQEKLVGAPCHKAKSITKFLAEKDVKTLPWPGYSPDMNPIEIVKNRLKKNKQYNTCLTD